MRLHWTFLLKHPCVRRNQHKEKFTLECKYFPKCQFKFDTDRRLERHLKAGHTKNPEFQKCPKCDRWFDVEWMFRKHLEGHETQEKIARGEKIPTKVLYRARRLHVCDLCGKRFQNTEGLRMHLLTHTGPESWEFECEICKRKCMTKAKLQDHLRTHTKEKPFVCQVCGRSYAHRHNLRIHVNNKHGDVMEDKARKVEVLNRTSKKGMSGNE